MVEASVVGLVEPAVDAVPIGPQDRAHVVDHVPVDEPDLRTRRADTGIRIERAHERREPSRVHHRIVVDQGHRVDDVEHTDTGVGPAGEAEVALVLHAHDVRPVRGDRHDRRIVDQHDLELSLPQRAAERLDAAFGERSAVVIDDDGPDSGDAQSDS